MSFFSPLWLLQGGHSKYFLKFKVFKVFSRFFLVKFRVFGWIKFEFFHENWSTQNQNILKIVVNFPKNYEFLRHGISANNEPNFTSKFKVFKVIFSTYSPYSRFSRLFFIFLSNSRFFKVFKVEWPPWYMHAGHFFIQRCFSNGKLTCAHHHLFLIHVFYIKKLSLSKFQPKNF